jgi:hypothetical protein
MIAFNSTYYHYFNLSYLLTYLLQDLFKISPSFPMVDAGVFLLFSFMVKVGIRSNEDPFTQ